MSHSTAPGNRIPAPRIAEIVKRFSLEYETNGTSNVDNMADRQQALSPLTILADQVDRSADWVYRLSEGRYQTLSFDDADRLLCAMNLVHLWWSDLSDIYYGADLGEWDVHEQMLARRRENAAAKREELDRVRAAA